ncbi:MAG TPA: hypothetical protein VFE46_04790 [Pirellulales bacterium]|jgi:hypothetical protein|nr:hypothetical protein [Pirellulales bacterium]
MKITLRYSTRTLFIAIAVIAIACAAFAIWGRPYLRKRYYEEHWMKAGAIAICDQDGFVKTLIADDATGAFSPASLAELAGSSHLSILVLIDTPTTDADIARLEDLPKIISLALRGTNVTDLGIAHIVKFHTLKYLFLRHTQISDACIPELGRMTWLKQLEIDQTQITEDGMKKLRALLPNTEFVSESTP